MFQLVILLSYCVLGMVMGAERVRREPANQESLSHIQVGFCHNACSTAGFTSCCDLTQQPNGCFTGTICNCFCDISCYKYNDCCPGIANTCSPLSTSICPQLTLENGNLNFNPSTNDMGPGTIAHHSCQQGYVLVGEGESTIRVCQEDSTWSGEELRCLPNCTEVPGPARGSVSYSPARVFSKYPPIRTIAKFTCDPGYILLHAPAPMFCELGNNGEARWVPSPQENTAECFPSTCATLFPDGACCKSTIDNTFCSRREDSPIIAIGPGNDEITCSCKESCLENKNPHNPPCCPDIGCSRTPGTTCTAISQTLGCCEGDLSDCYVEEGDCFCDAGCEENGDCCEGEFSESCDNVMGGGQGVRTGSWARLQLASEIRSMSRVREEPDESNKAQWELIVKELQEIQKHKTHKSQDRTDRQ